MDYKQKISEAVLGHALGDAVGVPVEFTQPHLLKDCPVTGMLENGSHGQPIGTWSDDTSMSLALVDTLSKSGDAPDYDMLMKGFEKWVMEAEYTATGEVFDVGRTSLKAIGNYARGNNIPWECGPKGEHSCGNGALMRILPAVFWLIRFYGYDFTDSPKALDIIYKLTAMTHGHEKCLMASVYYLTVCSGLLQGKSKDDALKYGINKAEAVFKNDPRFSCYLDDFSLLKDDAIKDPDNNKIQSSGYVIDTINATIWAFMSTDSYRACVLAAVNLGHDTDTVAAIAGGMAGMYYGIGGGSGIPLEWLGNLKRIEYIGELCSNFAKRLEEE